MRIDRLEIRSEWKNLEGFTIDLDESRDIAVLIGKNGAAKSNLLEAFITIFIDLDLGLDAPFAYEIKYELRGKKVVLTAEKGKKPIGTVDNKSTPLALIREKWTPNHVVAYYSGASDRFERLFYRHDQRALGLTHGKAKIDSEVLPFNRFIYARPVHGLFALLSFYFAEKKDFEDVTNFLKKLPRIESFDSALLVLHKPTWAKGEANDFWGAEGPVRELLERIREYSLAPFTRIVTLKPDFRRRESRELMYLYLPDVDALRALANDYGKNHLALFQALDTMRLSDLIEDFRVRVRITGTGKSIHTRQLSEGEQQLLTVLGLMRFTKDEGSLYILDEPDTHLNPAWSVDYIDYLRKIGGIERKSHTLLATHDPLIVAGLCRDQIRVLIRTETGRVVAQVPEENPRGMGVAGVLTSPLYGLESQLDPFSLRVLNRIYEVSFEPKSQKKTRHLRRLRKLVPSLEIIESSPDPYRNIARAAYQLTMDKIVGDDLPTQERRERVMRLSENLYNDAAEASQ